MTSSTQQPIIFLTIKENKNPWHVHANLQLSMLTLKNK
jgi:hypothetical protein